MTKTIYPNIVRGGVAIPLNKRNYYYIKGRLHKDGGVDIGENPKTGLEVEGGEIVKMEQGGMKVFSAVPMLAGMSPAERVLRGEDPDKVFAAQETFKKVNGFKDDGTKARLGKRKYIGSNEKSAAKQNADVRRQYWNYDTKLLQAVSDISSQYGIDPRIVISRMSREGIIDKAINLNNRIIKGDQYDANEIKDKSILDVPYYSDLFTNWGLDTIFDRIKKGYTKTNRPIYLKRNEVSNEVEGVNSGTVKNNYDALELLIAELASRQKEVKNKYPNLTSDELNSATLANYNSTTSYFNKLMKDGTYKTKFALNDDVNGIIIPKPKKYKNKENNVDYTEDDLPTYDIMVDYYDNLNKLPSYKKYFNIPEEKLNVSREDSFRKMIENSRINYYNDNHTLPYGTNYNYYNPYLDENRKEIKRFGGERKKAEWGMEEGSAADIITDMIPIVGSAKEITRLIKNPSWEQTGWTVVSVAADALGLGAAKILAKAAKAASVSKNYFKATKGVHKAVKLNPTIDKRIFEAAMIQSPQIALEAAQHDNNKKQFGGDMKHKLIEVNIGGNSKLIRVPRPSSTGKSERSEGYNRKQAQYGILEPILTNAYKKELDEDLKFIPEDIIRNIAKSYQPVTLPTVKVSVPQGKTSNNTKFKTWVGQNLNPKNNPSLYADGIGLLGNIAGSLISHSINKKMINSLKAPSAPVQEMARKLKTKYNINPQEKAIKESLDEYERQVLGNTASSRVALARINRGRNSAINNLLNLYGQKENIETQLLNQDAMNQQSVDARNIERINRHLSDVTNFNNKVSELKAENSVATTQNIISGISDLLTRREKRGQFDKTLSAQTLANPNLPAEMFREAGIWNEKMYNTYRKYNPLNQG